MNEMDQNKGTVFDPLRKKEVALTPEERVRQWFISVLRNSMRVPAHMMMSEVGFKLGDKPYRADIIIYDRKAKTLAVVECKRPEVPLDQSVVEQTVRYNMVLDVKYIFITNGYKTFAFQKDQTDGSRHYKILKQLPIWEEMLDINNIKKE